MVSAHDPPLVAVILSLFIIFSALCMLNFHNVLIIAHPAFKPPVTIGLRGLSSPIRAGTGRFSPGDGASPPDAVGRIIVPLVKP